jgi:ATP-dependent RNA helicase SUPV3L1/SUV3
MIEAGPGDGENDPPTAPTQSSPDFSAVQGFQVVGADYHATGQNAGGDEAWRDALRLELETRAARFHHAVDSAIVLSNDGVIRWLGDPVARLSPGPNMLTPGAVTLADEALPEAAREIVKARIELWLMATMRRILNPLLALAALQEGSEAVRDLAGRLAKSFGILEREPIRAQLKALAQSDRAELRKFGVRFGAYYVFVPALIKPAARTLALQLWGLQAPGDAGALLAALAQVASSGRTSLLFDRKISREGYRVAGYRPCGERVVRVDVIERLSAIIRGAIMESQARTALGPAARGRPNGFVVTGQMTSLTGCAGEQFASILRAIGFRSVEMKRSEFIGPQSAVDSPQHGEPPSPTERPEAAAEGRASAAGQAERSPDLPSTPPEATPLDAPEPEVSADGLCPAVAAAEPGAAAAVAPVLATSFEAEENAELIVVWRPDRSALSRRGPGDRTRQNRDRTANRERSATGPMNSPDSAGRNAAAAADAGRNRNKRKEPRLNLPAADVRKAAPRPPGGAAGGETARYDEKHRQALSGRDMSRSHSASERQERAKIDPNSPFAKLLELRPLLEGQANKRP